jgi:lysophospholipase L1-like esterase
MKAFRLALSLVLLGGMEIASRCVPFSPRWNRKLSSFRATRLFVPAENDLDTLVYRINPAYQSSFHPAEFPAEKKGAFRIFAVGGSATFGWGMPDPEKSCFLAQLRGILEKRHPGRKFEAINAGGLSLGSYRESLLADEISRHDPDLFIIYTGNNEVFDYPGWRDIARRRFSILGILATLEYSSLYLRLQDAMGWATYNLHGDRTFMESFGHFTGKDRENIDRIFGESLAHMAYSTRKAGAAVIYCTLPANLRVDPDSPRDWLRDASIHAPGMTGEKLREWENLSANARIEMKSGRWARALAMLEKSARLDPQYARTWSDIGKCLENLGRFQEARKAYWRHIDLSDRLITTGFNTIIRRTALEQECPLLDVQALFEKAAPHGIPGYELFVDSMHPNEAGNLLIASALADLVDRQVLNRK